MKEIHTGKRLVFILVTSVLLISWIPLASDPYKPLLVPLATIIYMYTFYSIGRLIQDFKSYPKTDNALLLLYLNILLTFSSVYFFLAAIDTNESMIFGLRAMNPHFSENYSLISVMEYMSGLSFTFINCVYYSLVTMATLGDSSIMLKNILPRIIVMFQVGYTLWLTGYALANHFSKKSTDELKEMERNLKSEISEITKINKRNIYVKNKCSLREFANKAMQRIRYALR